MKLEPELHRFIETPQNFPYTMHVNGYIVITLEPSYEIHIWSNCIQKPLTQFEIYNNNWCLLITPIIGNTIIKEYKQEPHTKHNTHNIYNMASLQNTTHSIKLIEQENKSLILGTKNFLMSGKYHTMRNTASLSVNFVSKINTRAGSFESTFAIPKNTLPIKELPDPMKGLHYSALPLIIKNASDKMKHLLIGD